MNNLFIGPIIHWLSIACVIGIGWIAGDERLHVVDFNSFIIAVLIVTIVTILVVLRTSKPGVKITREKLEDDTN